jgi:hypothetical protein
MNRDDIYHLADEKRDFLLRLVVLLSFGSVISLFSPCFLLNTAFFRASVLASKKSSTIIENGLSYID